MTMSSNSNKIRDPYVYLAICFINFISYGAMVWTCGTIVGDSLAQQATSPHVALINFLSMTIYVLLHRSAHEYVGNYDRK